MLAISEFTLVLLLGVVLGYFICMIRPAETPQWLTNDQLNGAWRTLAMGPGEYWFWDPEGIEVKVVRLTDLEDVTSGFYYPFVPNHPPLDPYNFADPFMEP